METITSYMEQDHVLIDGFAERALRGAAARESNVLRLEGAEFLRRLRRHIEMEEDVLFPAFEQRTGMTASGPSVQMRLEHGLMHPILGDIQKAVEADDAEGFRKALQALLDILQPHNVKEEQMMYPMLDQAAGSDAGALLAQVKEMAL